MCLSSLGLNVLVLLSRSQYRDCSLCLSLTEGAAVSRRLQLIDDLSYEDVKKCYRGSVSKTCPRTEQQEFQRSRDDSRAAGRLHKRLSRLHGDRGVFVRGFCGQDPRERTEKLRRPSGTSSSSNPKHFFGFIH